MTDVDRMTPAERLLREELQRELVPPPTPVSLHRAVEQMAVEAPSAGADRQHSAGRGTRLVVAAVAMAAAVLVAIVVTPFGLADRAGTTPPPTLPAITQPALPSAPPNPTVLEAARWLGPNSAWSVDHLNRLRITTDGGQTWSEPRPLPAGGDLGLEFQDAAHGNTAWIVTRGDQADLDVYTTDDGGATWATSPVDTVLGWQDGYGSVHFSDPEHGVFLVTTWRPRPEAKPDLCLGYATDDRGTRWTSLDDAPCIGPGGVLWADGSTGIVDTHPDDGVALTRDGGRTWIETILPAYVARPFHRLGLTTRDGGIVRQIGVSMPEGAGPPTLPVVVLDSVDDGVSWKAVSTSDAIDGRAIEGLHAFDANHWLATISSPEPPGLATLAETYDAGQGWSTVAEPGLVVGTPLDWADRLHGTVQGARMTGDCAPDCSGTGTVWLTNDGGQTWHEPPF